MSEMHAGDALWFLHAGITHMQETFGDRPSLSHLRDCARVIGAHIGVHEPLDADARSLLEALRRLDSSQPVPHATQRGSTSGASSTNSGGGKWSDPERIEHARAMLDAMVESEVFEWAEIVSDIHAKIHGSSPFVTNKQLRALFNIARKGEYEDGAEFWDEFQDAHPEAASFVEACANEA